MFQMNCPGLLLAVQFINSNRRRPMINSVEKSSVFRRVPCYARGDDFSANQPAVSQPEPNEGERCFIDQFIICSGHKGALGASSASINLPLFF
jgi:hypothetical protein